MQGGLSAVVSSGFGVDKQARDLRGFELEGVLKRREQHVDLRHRERIRQGAVAGDFDPPRWDGSPGCRECRAPAGKAAAVWRRVWVSSRVWVASSASWAGRSMVAGSDSMWVRIVAIPGTSPRMFDSRRVTEIVRGTQGQGFVDLEVQLEVAGRRRIA